MLSNNATEVARVSKQGGSRRRVLLAMALLILLWAEDRLTSLMAVHLKSSLNWVAGFLSRKRVQDSEWSLNSKNFSDDCKQMGSSAGRAVFGSCKSASLERKTGKTVMEIFIHHLNNENK